MLLLTEHNGVAMLLLTEPDGVAMLLLTEPDGEKKRSANRTWLLE